MPKDGIEMIDAGGFYCYLTKFESFMKHEFEPYLQVLGPDVNYGLALRKTGSTNYVDWSIKCEHYDQKGQLVKKNPVQSTLTKGEKNWTQGINPQTIQMDIG